MVIIFSRVFIISNVKNLNFISVNNSYYLFSFFVCFANERGIARGQRAKATLRSVDC